jgi:putative transposase
MTRSFTSIWTHALWSTKDNLQLIQPNIEAIIYSYLALEFSEIECPVRIINGMPDHVHCLFLSNPRLSLCDIMKQVKGSSSHRINEENLTVEKFSWQRGFVACSVSESLVEQTYQHILNQKDYHKNISFQTELSEFIQLHHIHLVPTNTLEAKYA